VAAEGRHCCWAQLAPALLLLLMGWRPGELQQQAVVLLVLLEALA
jgi:hypothetical protein